LIRAYGGTARLAIHASETEILIPKSIFKVVTPGSFVGALYDTVNKHGGIMEDESYGNDGDLAATVVCKTEVLEGIQISLKDATRGEIRFLTDDEGGEK